MESLRAFMLITAVKDVVSEEEFSYEPANVENDPSTSEPIIENGFHLMFKNPQDRERAISVIKTVGSVQGYQPYDAAPPEPKPAAAAPAAAPAAAAPAAAQAAAPAAAAPPHRPASSTPRRPSSAST